MDPSTWLPQNEICRADWLLSMLLTVPGMEPAGPWALPVIATAGVLLCVISPWLMLMLLLYRAATPLTTLTSRPWRTQPTLDSSDSDRWSLMSFLKAGLANPAGPRQRPRAPRVYWPGPTRLRNLRRVNARPKRATSRSGTHAALWPRTFQSTGVRGTRRRGLRHLPLGTVGWSPNLLLPGQRVGFSPCDFSLRELQLAQEGEKGKHSWRRHGAHSPAIRVVLRGKVHPRERAMAWVRPDRGTSTVLVWRRAWGEGRYAHPWVLLFGSRSVSSLGRHGRSTGLKVASNVRRAQR